MKFAIGDFYEGDFYEDRIQGFGTMKYAKID